MSRLLALALLWTAMTVPLGAQAPASEEEGAWNETQDWFNKKEWVLAVVQAEDFARRYPQSARAPQAIYQAACGYLMLQKPAEGNDAFRRLATNHFDSPWAQWAMQLNLDANTLLQLADEFRNQGRPQRLQAPTARAAAVYGLFGQRFANDNRAKGEVVYKWADCAQRLGNEQAATAAFQQLTKADQADWSKLAAFRLAGRQKFQDEMNDLLDLAANGEEKTLFLDLADRYQKELTKEAQSQCAYLRGHCVEGAERIAIFQKICNDQPGSPWAAEAAFFLAEHAFEQGKRTEAQAVYRALAARHSDSPRAQRLAAWGTWIDHHEADDNEIQRLFVDCLKRFDARKGGVAVTLKLEADTLPFPIDARLAYFDRQVLIRAALGDLGFACGLQRPNLVWYRFLNQPAIQRVEKSALPVLTFKVKEFPKDSINFQAGVVMSEDPAAVSDIEIEPAVGAIVARQLTHGKHLHRRTRPDGGIDFILEWPHRNPTVVRTLTWQFSDQGKLQEISFRGIDSQGKKTTAVLNELAFGDPIAREEFAMPIQPGVEVRNLQQINQLEILAQVMNLFGPTYQALAKAMPANR